MTGLPEEQIIELAQRIEDYLGGWQPARGRRRERELFDAVAAVLFYYRHHCSQDVTGVVFGVSQSTISRTVNALEEPIAAVCDCAVAELGEVLSGRVLIPDATLIPTGHRAGQRQLYAGKRHRAGAAVQVLVGTEGQLCHVAEPVAGSTHDVVAFRQTGLADVVVEHLAQNLVIADLGYLGEPVVTPVKKAPKGEHSPAQIDANKQLSGLRAVVERCIAHLKNWKILATGYRRPLKKLAACLAAVTALEFYRLNWNEF